MAEVSDLPTPRTMELDSKTSYIDGALMTRTLISYLSSGIIRSSDRIMAITQDSIPRNTESDGKYLTNRT